MPAQVAEPFRVLLVDLTGGGRAPAGELFLQRELDARGIASHVIQVSSAGLDAADGELLHPRTARVLSDHGIDASGYRQRKLTAAMVQGADLIICGDADHRDHVVERFPRAQGRAFSLSQMFYLYEKVVAIAPLHEHPRLLAAAASEGDVPNDFDLPPIERIEERADALGQQISRSAFWIATIWQSMLPAGPDQTPAPAFEDVTVDLIAFGVTVRVVCHGDVPYSLGTKVQLRWERLLAPEPHEAPEVTISIAVVDDPAGAASARSQGWLVYDSIDLAMHFLSSTVTVRSIDARAGEMVMLHAAGLSDAAGNVVGFVAPSGTGKTTLSRTLGRAYGYVTDETLAIRFDGTVLAYPKPLSVLVGESRVKDQQSAYDLELLEPPASLRLARIVILDRRADAGSVPQFTHLPLLHGMAELAEQTSYLPRLPRPLHTLADAVEAVGGLWRVTYREASDLVPVFPGIVSGEVL